MGYGNERMPWHPRKAAGAASIERYGAGYGSIPALMLLFARAMAGEFGRAVSRWVILSLKKVPRR